jgi:hypothetical protein
MAKRDRLEEVVWKIMGRRRWRSVADIPLDVLERKAYSGIHFSEL